jgi:hypothetical protein
LARNRLERHRADYESITGRPFEHFFSPVLYVDEPVEVMRGHIINEAFIKSSKAWVIQRKDVDGFFGGFFEGDFELLQHMHRALPLNYLGVTTAVGFSSDGAGGYFSIS